MENNWNHVNMCNDWQATTTGLWTKFVNCNLYYFERLNHQSEIFDVSNVF